MTSPARGGSRQPPNFLSLGSDVAKRCWPLKPSDIGPSVSWPYNPVDPVQPVYEPIPVEEVCWRTRCAFASIAIKASVIRPTWHSTCAVKAPGRCPYIATTTSAKKIGHFHSPAVAHSCNLPKQLIPPLKSTAIFWNALLA
ncbi:hypothetical protein K469DRAFT_801832 [Zopfia rhizophila CBS 207.26]|uniref:Uncharacterized protein n=1 Tax=Zopfia rhizophila CBS 207.26 TaxID=1314779 RepID=A0A6A6DHZ9_9PEZI|nr:hypothetical protein K469DRAFT_801832 [Zopfia rhizophila CBS 207.26]